MSCKECNAKFNYLLSKIKKLSCCINNAGSDILITDGDGDKFLSDDGTYKFIDFSGKEVELGHNSTHLLWKYVDDTNWTNLIELSEITGNDGREVQMQVNATHIQWRYAGTISWTDLIALSAIKGADGREIELQKTATHVQWRYVGGTWTNLILLTDIKGDPGLGFTQITESARLALVPTNNLPYWQTDGAIGGYYWRDGGWAFLGAKKKKTITANTYSCNPIIDIGYILEFTNDCTVTISNANVTSGNTIDIISVAGKTVTLDVSGTMTLDNAIPTQSLIGVTNFCAISILLTSGSHGIAAGGLM